MNIVRNRYLIMALILGLIFHGSAIFYTMEETYDALIHLFFAEHYAHNWQEPWSYKWYTGFTVMGYPPLVHQLLAVFSFIGGFKFALYSYSLFMIVLFISGVYRYSLLITKDENTAGYASIFAVFSSVFIETFHLFGQLPTLTGIALLMHCMPEIYAWINTRKVKYLVSSLLLIGVMVCSHHLTPLFGIIFFITPLIGLAIIDKGYELMGDYRKIRLRQFVRILSKSTKPILLFIIPTLILLIVCILPYWINVRDNPITQVPIPHGSRDNYLKVLSSGLVFFLIPYGILLVILPYIFYRLFSKRLLFFGLSFSIMFLLGTGGTTPIPKLILGQSAYSILTLDRFSFWAAIMSYPLAGEFFYRFIKGDYNKYILDRFGRTYFNICLILCIVISSVFVVFTVNIGKFRPSQPQAIKMLPIINFINRDMHYKWRYLTLGFGDQMAWLAAQTKALSVDGNYHSARRLPELTTRAVERLENSKFKGLEGIGSLQQFLANSDKFNLKYVFSNDKFYDPILYFSGWERLSYLENGIMVWEKKNVKPVPIILPKIDVPLYQKIIWSFVPISLTCLSIIWFLITINLPNKNRNEELSILYEHEYFKFTKTMFIWNFFIAIFSCYGLYLLYIENSTQISPENVVKAYYDALDFKKFAKSHSYLDKKADKSLDQFLLEISVNDGLLNSYSKLEDINTKIINKQKDTIFVEATTKWITPLITVKKREIIKTIKRNKRWYIIPEKNDPYRPANQFFNFTRTSFYNQGRRKITTQQTFHEDVLPQPIAYFHQAKLISKDNQYHIIGEIQNIDYFPCALDLKAILYDENDTELASYSSRFQNKHYLNPFEKTVFKIDFEEVAWLNNDKDNASFDPEEFHQKILDKKPVKFVLHASTSTATKNLYQSVQLNDLKLSNDKIDGQLFNAADKEVTIPLILFSYMENNEIIWVDNKFIKESIRPHRKREFSYKTISTLDIKTIVNSTKECYINGIENNDAILNRNNRFNMKKDIPIMIKDKNHQMKIQISNFIGN